jgi:peptidoglycan/xylan/chitin deacetylase (PgdA/CDA1 family)
MPPPAAPPLAPAVGWIGQLGGHYPAGAVALTFDDGPDPTWTPQILRVLAQHHAVGTFFDIGTHASARPDIVRAEFAAGHGVGNHTWTHPDLTHLLTPAVLSQLDQTDAVLQQSTGVRTSCLRPPYDAIDPAVRALTAQRGLTMMLYDVDPRDWARPGAQTIAARVLGAIHAGSIVDLHDGGGNRSETVAALPLILQGLAARHLTPVALCR